MVIGYEPHQYLFFEHQSHQILSVHKKLKHSILHWKVKRSFFVKGNNVVPVIKLPFQPDLLIRILFKNDVRFQQKQQERLINQNGLRNELRKAEKININETSAGIRKLRVCQLLMEYTIHIPGMISHCSKCLDIVDSFFIDISRLTCSPLCCQLGRQQPS